MCDPSCDVIFLTNSIRSASPSNIKIDHETQTVEKYAEISQKPARRDTSARLDLLFHAEDSHNSRLKIGARSDRVLENCANFFFYCFNFFRVIYWIVFVTFFPPPMRALHSS